MEASIRESIRRKVDALNEARRAYEQEDIELMTNAEYDAMYDELEALEKETGIIFDDSPTQNVGYEIESDLPVEEHPRKMLSMNKTKDIEALQEFIGDHEGIFTWKVDGITIVLTYEGGKLLKVLTRGNGIVGEVITETARNFRRIPEEIPYMGKAVIRGEAHLKYSEYAELDENMEDVDAIYKNPRNLASATVRQADPETAAKRGISFMAFSVVEAEGVDFRNSRSYQLQWLREQGFLTVEAVPVTRETAPEKVGEYLKAVHTSDLPADGMVFTFEDMAYGISLGETPKYPLDSIAFKWQDETAVVEVKGIKWRKSERGFLNPVAVFEPVMLEGKEVSEAALHNLDVMEQMKLAKGDQVEVYLSNMVVPQVIKNLTGTKMGELPKTCPVCGCRTEVVTVEGTRVLICTGR